MQGKTCEDECTKATWCIGYHLEKPGKCSLMTATGNCDSGMIKSDGKIAKTADQLIPGFQPSEEDVKCMGKALKGK